MASVSVNRRAALDDRIDVGHGNQDLDFVSGHRLGDGKLVQVARVVVVDGSPEQVSEVANLFPVDACRVLNQAEFAQCFGGKVGEQSPFGHRPAGDSLQNGTVLFAGRIHGFSCGVFAPANKKSPLRWGRNLERADARA